MINKNSLCFTARWISPATRKPVTAAFFCSFVHYFNDLYGIERYQHDGRRF